MTLDCLPIGQPAIITGLIENGCDDAPIVNRLKEIGFIENTPILVENYAPFSKDPITVRARGSLFAMRRSEAALICVQKDYA